MRTAKSELSADLLPPHPAVSLEPLIRSSSNAKLRLVAQVLAGKDRSRIVLDGIRLVEDALAAGLELELLLLEPAQRAFLERWGARVQNFAFVEAELLRRTSELEHSAGILALARAPARAALADLNCGENLLLVVACGIADPGNLGALARSAEALGASALCTIGGTHPCAAKTLRGSMGSLLRLPLYVAESAAAAHAALAAKGVRQVAALTRGGRDPAHFDWRGPLALWISGETGRDLEQVVSLEALSIPMSQGIESLNVAVATALLLYEARRARGAQR